MNTPVSSTFTLMTQRALADIEPGVWDEISHGQPFGSYRWHGYAEKIMTDCRPFYILVFDNSKLVGRAVFYYVPSEPLPLKSAFLRSFAQTIFRRWPLFISRTPLAGLSGVVLSEHPAREQILNQIARAAYEQARRTATPFMFFDFVDQKLSHASGWGAQFKPLMINDPGTQMELSWTDFEHYLSSLGKDERYHYRRVQRKAQELGIIMERHTTARYMDEALKLIHKVEAKHAATQLPWTRALLENLALIDGTWLTARIENRLVGCGLTLRDNGAQMNTALGLVDDIPYVYFALLYESLRLALEKGVCLMRLGSGAYDVKRRLGFQIENNNYVMAASPFPILQRLVQWMAP